MMHYTADQQQQFYRHQTYETSSLNHVDSYLVDSASHQYHQAPYGGGGGNSAGGKIWYNNYCLKAEEPPYNLTTTSGYQQHYSSSDSSTSYYETNATTDYKPIQVALTEASKADTSRLVKRPYLDHQDAAAAAAGKKHCNEMMTMMSMPSPLISSTPAGGGHQSSSLSQFSPSSSSSSSATSPRQSSSAPPPISNEDEFIFESLYKAYIAGTLSKSRYKRLIANERERKRMHGLNSAFENLRAVLPSLGSNKQFSKFETLQMAKSYIGALRELLSQSQSQSQSQDGQSCVDQHASYGSYHRTESECHQPAGGDPLPFVKIIKIDSRDFM